MSANEVKGGTMRARTLVTAALALGLSGCIGLGGGGKPPAALIGLTPSAVTPAGKTVSGKSTDAVLVLEPDADRRLAVLRVPVQVDASRVAYLKDVQWVDRPARQFAHLVAETLRARGTRVVFEEGQGVGLPGIRLSGRLVDMGYDGPSRSVVVRFDALRATESGEVTSRRFEAVVPNVPAKAKEVGPALNSAANDVAKQVADWMGD